MINEALCREQWKKEELSGQDITQQEIFEMPSITYETIKHETDFKGKIKNKVQLKFNCIGIFILFKRVCRRCWYKVRGSNMI